jgi:thiamine-phosphate pyrophosphorylase
VKVPDTFGFYGILTNPKVGYESLAQIMVEAGVRFIQLRMKNTPHQSVLSTAAALRKIIPPGIPFIINDDPEIASEVGADGVHLGQGDMPYDEARGILGPKAIIGLSTHNAEQTQKACSHRPDYIGVGPVYETPTKTIPDPVIGILGMQEMLKISTVPAVALGGIDLSNAKNVIAAGARNLCAVRCINDSDHPKETLRRMLDLVGQR